MKAIAADLSTLAQPRPWEHPSDAGALPRIGGLALAHPDTSFTQEQVLGLLGLSDDEFARRIFGRCGVRRRRLGFSDEFLATTVQGRTAAVEEQLFGYALRAIDELKVDPAEIGVVVSATLYSLGGPTLAHRLVDHYRMDPATDKYHVVGVGCASAVPLVRLASQTLREHPHKKALIVAAESMAGILTGAGVHDARSKTVGSSIFGDGCAAMLIEAGDVGGLEYPPANGGDAQANGGGVAANGWGAPANGRSVPANRGGPSILASKVHQIGGTLGAVRMQITPQDSYLHLIRELPDVAGDGLGELTEEFLAANGLEREAIDHWLVHPGGRRIIESMQRALGISRRDVQVSYEVLAEHGNVGTPSIFYVLQRTYERRHPHSGELGLMVTVGPGVTVGLMLLQW